MEKERNRDGGVVASREGSENRGKEGDPRFAKKGVPIYVKYRDHVLFKNCNPGKVEFCTRELMGWLVGEDPKAILICIDQPTDPLKHEKINATGLVILKDCILETYKVKIKKPFNHSRLSYLGPKQP
jgi:hypothetical protein